jgi:hypothetical protein
VADKNVKLFDNKRVRTVWNDAKEEWYFSIVDAVGVLTDQQNELTARKYWNKLKQRLKEDDGNETVTNCHQLKLLARDGKMRLTDVADTEQILRLIQSIPSPKAEPFKLWLAKVGKERIDETVDPELTFERAFVTYLKKGYSRDWVNQRLLSIRVRKELTDEWEDRGVKGGEYGILTDEITKAWAGLSTRQYKNLKGLRKENLRDNMSMLELTLNQLAEVATTEISKEEKPVTFEENRQVAKRGGSVAGVARKAVEAQTGKPVLTSKKAVDFAQLITDVIEYKVDKKDKENIV